MATHTDYDAPLRNTVDGVEDDLSPGLISRGADARSGLVDVDEEGDLEVVRDTMVLDTVSRRSTINDLTIPVVPKQSDEFMCIRCFLLQRNTRLASRSADRTICRDCA